MAPPADRAIGRLAARQHGRISLDQLRNLGLSASNVRDRVAAGRLVRRLRGVYAVGHALLTREAQWIEAVLAYGHAVLSHRSAAQLWGLLKGFTRPVHVSVPKRRTDSRKGIRAHATTTLLTRDVTRRKGILVTTVARTLLDLAESGPEHIFWKAFEQAEIDNRLNRGELDDVLARATGRRGQHLLAAAVRASDPLSKQLKSKLERRFLRLLRQAGLPTPLVNRPLLLPNGQTIHPDFHWPDHKLILETDGRETHLTGAAFERDRRRDQQLTLLGYRCPRTTWLQLDEEAEVVVGVLRRLIAQERAAS